MKFLLGQKLGMSQMFGDEGRVMPVTLVKAGPCYVTQIRTNDKDGYEAIQIGFAETKNNSKPQRGHLKKVKQENLKWLREFRTQGDKADLKEGDEIKADIFQEGEIIKVSGISKGKGFAGVVKRHGFHGAPATHGTKHNLRAPGSIGSAFPQRVMKGKKMAGRMGSERVTTKNLKIVAVDVENNLIAIKGAVPGIKGSLIEITA